MSIEPSAWVSVCTGKVERRVGDILAARRICSGVHTHAGRSDNAGDRIRGAFRFSSVGAVDGWDRRWPRVDGRRGRSRTGWFAADKSFAADCHEGIWLALPAVACLGHWAKRTAASTGRSRTANELHRRRLDAVVQPERLGDDAWGCGFFRWPCRWTVSVGCSAGLHVWRRGGGLAFGLVHGRADICAASADRRAVASAERRIGYSARRLNHTDMALKISPRPDGGRSA